jgi:hypothetical protein
VTKKMQDSLAKQLRSFWKSREPPMLLFVFHHRRPILLCCCLSVGCAGLEAASVAASEFGSNPRGFVGLGPRERDFLGEDIYETRRGSTGLAH